MLPCRDKINIDKEGTGGGQQRPKYLPVTFIISVQNKRFKTKIAFLLLWRNKINIDRGQYILWWGGQQRPKQQLSQSYFGSNMIHLLLYAKKYHPKYMQQLSQRFFWCNNIPSRSVHLLTRISCKHMRKVLWHHNFEMLSMQAHDSLVWSLGQVMFVTIQNMGFKAKKLKHTVQWTESIYIYYNALSRTPISYFSGIRLRPDVSSFWHFPFAEAKLLRPPKVHFPLIFYITNTFHSDINRTRK